MYESNLTQRQSKAQTIAQLSKRLWNLQLGDIYRVQSFVEAIVKQKEGKRNARSEKHRQFNAIKATES